MPRKSEPGLWLPSPDVDRWSYIARFSAYQGDATVSLVFFDETASRRSRSKHLFVPRKEAFPESPQEVAQALLDVVIDWKVMMDGGCTLRNPTV